MENSSTYTKVQNYLIHALCRVNGTERKKKARQCISLGVLQSILAICRLTIGFHLDDRALTIEQITRITGFSRGHQGDYLKRALKLNMITRYNCRTKEEFKKKPRYIYGLNLDPLTWQTNFRFPARHFSSKHKEKDVPLQGYKMYPYKGTKDVPLQGYNILAKLLKDPFGQG